MELRIGHFVALMAFVVAIQGTYLGFVVGILTALERRFGISSELSGLLLALYDIGHTVAILLVGYYGRRGHAPRLTGIGVLLSAAAMFLLALPVAIYGTASHDEEMLKQHWETYRNDFACQSADLTSQGDECREDRKEHIVAFVILAFGQILAGIFAAPFNTIAYVYVDANAGDHRNSPLFLGLLTSMYAFAPAFGFTLAAGLNRVYTTLSDPPPHVTPRDDHWIGAWWLGFIICGILYLLAALPFFFFPKTLTDRRGPDGKALMHDDEEVHQSCSESLREFPQIVCELAKNKVYVTMVLAWVFGSYLIGGYQTYLPKYIETQFGRSASIADIYAGFISIGAVASSTAIGGWILSKYNIEPRKSILLLAGAWSIISATYLIGMSIGCDEPKVYTSGLLTSYPQQFWSADTINSPTCSEDCNCQNVFRFEPVNIDGANFYSPCHAGCREYDYTLDMWYDCACAGGLATVQKGLVHERCALMFAYIPVMFVGLFAGNLFFMVTMMIVLRSVYDDQKVMALSLASCATNLLGFIPAPILFGWVMDGSCSIWSSRCPHDVGNCVVYNNDKLRYSFHGTNAGIQALAVIFALLCYFFSRSVTLPEEEEDQEVEMIEMPRHRPDLVPTKELELPKRTRVTDL